MIYNDAAARLYGARHPHALGRPLPDAFPEGWAAVAPLYSRAFAGEAVQVMAQPLNTRGEGAPADIFDAALLPVRDDVGSVMAVHMTGQEVGARVRAEAALRESEERFRGFAENSADVLWIASADGSRLEYLSPAFERMFGDARNGVMMDLSCFIDLVHPEGCWRWPGNMMLKPSDLRQQQGTSKASCIAPVPYYPSRSPRPS